MNKWQQQVYDMLRAAGRNNLPCTIPADVTHIPANMMLEADKAKWISIRDALPGLREKVLFTPMCNEGAIYIGELNAVGEHGAAYFAVRCGKRKTCYSATHWMQLPELPKMDGGAEDV